MEEQAKRTRRKITKEEKIAELQAKIESHRQKIEELSKKIMELNEPPVSMRDVTSKIKELDVPLTDVMKAVEKLGKKISTRFNYETKTTGSKRSPIPISANRYGFSILAPL